MTLNKSGIVLVGMFFLGGLLWLNSTGRLLATQPDPMLPSSDQTLVTTASLPSSVSSVSTLAGTATVIPTIYSETQVASTDLLDTVQNYLPLIAERKPSPSPTSTTSTSVATSTTLSPTPTMTPPPPTPTATLIPSPLNQIGTQWSPYLEWSFTNPTFTSNPYDLVASVVFTHTISGETRRTEMFYAEGNTWKFRFAGTSTGIWYFTTTSEDPDLDGKTGGVLINPNLDPDAQGFVVARGNKWGRSATENVFVPQYVMYTDPDQFADNPTKIDTDIQIFLQDHGFSGFHVQVYCRWFELETKDCSRIASDDPNPDPRTFEALELLINRTYAAGGVVHLWMWGDDERGWNTKRWGLNGPQDQRLQRYIAARLGSLPGWSMGYGFDLHEWVGGPELETWYGYLEPRLAGGQPLGARASKDQLDQFTEVLDYASYEQVRPDYNQFVAAITARPAKPTFSEDRFRIFSDPSLERHFSSEQLRRMLWQTAMAGGVAAIWGNLEDGRDTRNGSLPFPNAAEIKTYSMFFQQRFTSDIERCNQLTSGICLQRPTNAHYIFYQEQTSAIEMNLAEMAGSYNVIAIDTQKPYEEISIGTLRPGLHVWSAPYVSDWAIAVGDF